MKKEEAIIVSKLQNEQLQSFEYWIRLPDRSIQKCLLRTNALEVGDRLAVNKQEGTYKILHIL